MNRKIQILEEQNSQVVVKKQIKTNKKTNKKITNLTLLNILYKLFKPIKILFFKTK